MKNHPILLSLLFSLALTNFSLGAEESVDMEPRLPNQLLSEQFEARFVGDGFMITDRAKGGEPVRLYSMPPVYRAAWTGDGQTLATVEHVAGGSDFACFHFNAEAGKWFRVNVVPEGVYRGYQVTKWNVGRTDVTITYRVETDKNEEITTRTLEPLSVNQTVFNRFFDALNAHGRSGSIARVLALSPDGSFRQIPGGGRGPIHGRGFLAIDTDGTGSAHSDPTHQKYTSAMKDASDKFLPRRAPLPPGCQDLNADVDYYGVAPKNFAKVNGGSLEVGNKMNVDPPNQKEGRIKIGDFGPNDQHGEVSYAEIPQLGYMIRQTSHGPYPWDGVTSADIPVDVTYYP